MREYCCGDNFLRIGDPFKEWPLILHIGNIAPSPTRLRPPALRPAKDLAGFDFAAREINKALTRQFHRCVFLEDAHNIVLIGGSEPES